MKQKYNNIALNESDKKLLEFLKYQLDNKLLLRETHNLIIDKLFLGHLNLIAKKHLHNVNIEDIDNFIPSVLSVLSDRLSFGIIDEQEYKMIAQDLLILYKDELILAMDNLHKFMYHKNNLLLDNKIKTEANLINFKQIIKSNEIDIINISDLGLDSASYIYNMMKNYNDKKLITQLKNTLQFTIKNESELQKILSVLNKLDYLLRQDFFKSKKSSQESQDQIIQQALDIDNVTQRYDFIKDKFKDDIDGLSFAIGALGLFY